MRYPANRLIAVILALPLAAGCESEASSGPTSLEPAAMKAPDLERFNVPEEFPNGPFYSMIGISPFTGDLRLPRTDAWGAVPLIREAGCIPPDFDLLSIFDLTPAFPGGPPRPFLCPSTLTGHLIFKDFGTPQQKLVQSQLHELDEVSIVFAEWGDIADAIDDDVLTLAELLALPSAFVASATHYKETVVTGSLAPGQVAFRLVARGTTPGGATFRLHYVDHGPGATVDGATHIEFR